MGLKKIPDFQPNVVVCVTEALKKFVMVAQQCGVVQLEKLLSSLHDLRIIDRHLESGFGRYSCEIAQPERERRRIDLLESLKRGID